MSTRSGLFFMLLCIVAMPAAAATVDKNKVTLCMALEPPVLDPTLGAGQPIREVTYGNIYEGLTAIDRNGDVVPRLAESWNAGKDGLSYTFRLRPNVVFHDGSKLSAQDVKFSFERARQPGSKNTEKWIYEAIEGIEVVDDLTVKFTLKKPNALFLYGLGWGDAVIFSPKSAPQNGTHPVGTGPYKFESWERGNRLVLKRFDKWWGQGASIGTAIFRFIPDAQAQVTAIESGDCDMLAAGAPPELVEKLRANPDLTISIGQTEGETILAMNNKRPPFNDIRVRRAITAAIDRKLVIEGAMSGFATPIGSHFSPQHPAYVDLSTFAPFDPVKAKALLTEAGFANGFSATISVPPLAYARRSAEIIAQMLSQVGIKISLVPLEFPQWLERVYAAKDYDMSIISHTEPLDIKVYARPDYYFQYTSGRFSALMNNISTELDETRRTELYQQAQRQLAEDAVNVFLFELPEITIARKGLTGMWVNWPIPVNPVAELSWQ